MEFTNFKADGPTVIAEYNAARSTYNAKNSPKDLNDTIYDTVYGYVKRKPDAYLSLGVYWWSVKALLQAKGYDLAGYVESPALVDTYSVKNADGSVHPQATLMAAFTFRDWYFENYFEGNRDFLVNDDTGDMYALNDETFEQSFV